MGKRVALRRIVVCISLALSGATLSVSAFASGNAQSRSASSVHAQTSDGAAVGTASKAGEKQSNSKTPQKLKTVTVTASRIVGISDKDLISPEANVSRLTLHPVLATNIGLSINKLPQFAAGTTPFSASRTIAGGPTGLNLRGLGGSETLVLLDRQRFIGGFNSIPSILVKGTQIVTGGASAAWGSGAVAGVVNIRLDKTYTGFDARIQRGITSRGSGQQTNFQFKFGNQFAGGKGHYIVGGTFASNLGIGNYASHTGFVTSLPIGNGKEKSFEHVELTYEAIGGVINTGALSGMVFNPDGTLRPFDHGTVQTPSTTFQVGGDGYFFIDNNPAITPYKHYNVLTHISYQLSSNVKAIVQAQFAKRYTRARWLSASKSGIKINIDNAFLPSKIKNTMRKAGETSFLMGRANQDFAFPEMLSSSNKISQFTVGLKGHIPSTFWHWHIYASYGKDDSPEVVLNQLSTVNFPRAVDAVIDPKTNKPVCRIALTDPSTDCVPIDLFGEGAPSAAAAQYVTNNSAIYSHTTLSVFSASMTGTPVTLPAGPLRVATGIDGREVSLKERVGPDDIANITEPFDFTPLSGKFNVKEWFGEVHAPLVADVPGAKNLSIDAAARYSDYSTSGPIWSFKGGFNDEIIQGVRIRASWSQDIRAPNIGELFSGQNLEINLVTNPFTGKKDRIRQLNGGNPNLSAEKARTRTAGIIISPPSIRGFTAELDYYHINVKNGIAAPNVQFVVNRCHEGLKSACALITFGPNHLIEKVVTTDQNFASEKDEGVDIDFKYVRPATLFGNDGFMHARLMGTYTRRLERTSNGVTTKVLGSFTGRGVPRWAGFGELGFSSKAFSLFTTVRFLGSMKTNRHANIVNNDISPTFFVNIGTRISLDKSGKLQLGLSVRNVTDVLPNAKTSNIWYFNPLGRYYLASLNVKL